jgi:23S rRNA (pseudouridine1915-N3)-methyltransferase
MKIEFSTIGKTNEAYLIEGCAIFEKRLKHYNPFEVVCVPDVKNGGKLSVDLLKEKEGEAILSRLQADDFLILLDEKGKLYTSEEFAGQLEKWLQSGGRKMVFQVGGAFGFSETVYERANMKIALSPMTFSHQMVRLFFLEQLYRGFSILRNEKYHNS